MTHLPHEQTIVNSITLTLPLKSGINDKTKVYYD